MVALNGHQCFWLSGEKSLEERRGEEEERERVREEDPRLVFGEGGRERKRGREEKALRPLISKCLLLRIASPLHLP